MIRPASKPSAARPDREPPRAGKSDEDLASLAAYIADMTAELATLAGRSDLPMLTYFLNLARVEAEIQARERGGVPLRRG